MLLAFLQSTVDPTLRSLIANLTAIARGGDSVPTCASAAKAAEEEARVFNDNEGAGAGAVTYQASGACVNSKKVPWTYMRGAFSHLSCFVI
jgi:hypothetical protein